jgi:hypothetical protein
MKRTYSIILVFLLIVSIGNGQTKTNSIKITNGKRTKEFLYNQGNFLEFVFPDSKDSNVSIYRSVQGTITKITKDSLILHLTLDYIIQRNQDYLQIETRKIYQNPTEYLKLRFDQLSQINYQSKNSNNWVEIGASSILLGSLISLILAPLISINYKTGQVNSTRYITCASIGLAFVAIGIPIVASSKEKKFYLKKDHAPKNSKIWRIK